MLWQKGVNIFVREKRFDNKALRLGCSTARSTIARAGEFARVAPHVVVDMPHPWRERAIAAFGLWFLNPARFARDAPVSVGALRQGSAPGKAGAARDYAPFADIEDAAQRGRARPGIGLQGPEESCIRGFGGGRRSRTNVDRVAWRGPAHRRPYCTGTTRWLGTAIRREEEPSIAMSKISFSAADNPECKALTP
jgi:hypothetical protein